MGHTTFLSKDVTTWLIKLYGNKVIALVSICIFGINANVAIFLENVIKFGTKRVGIFDMDDC